MQTRRIIIGICGWCVVWGTGGWLFGHFEMGKDFSWLIGMPLYLSVLIAIWWVVKGTRILGVCGAPIGLLVGGLVGGICFLPFMMIGSLSNGLALRTHPEWVSVEVIWAFAGFVCGGIVGLLNGLIEGMFSGRNGAS